MMNDLLLFSEGRLPGTTIEIDLRRGGAADEVLTPIFYTGGLVLSQVASLTGLEPHTVQNWVKRGFVSPPVNKKYSRSQFCRIAIINSLRDSLQIEKIVCLLNYLGGGPVCAPAVGDSALYEFVVKIAAVLDGGEEIAPAKLNAALDGCLAGGGDMSAAMRSRLKNGLGIAWRAYLSSRLARQAELMISILED